MRIAVIDNYDSFIHTIVYYIKSLSNAEVIVMKNDMIDFDVVESCDRILLSPGPGLPNESGQLMQVIKEFYKEKPMLGICLGHQALYQFFGGELENIYPPLQGVSSDLNLMVANHFLWNDTLKPVSIAHYHAWIASSKNIPHALNVLAYDSNQNIMAFEHKVYPLIGLQFHPESVLTSEREKIFINWLENN